MIRPAILPLLLAAGCAVGAPPPATPPEPGPPPAVPVSDPRAGLKQLRERLVEGSDRAATLNREAHEALDQGRYDEAADLHRRSQEAARAAAEARREEEVLVRAEIRRLVKDLDDDEIAVRETATRELLELVAAPDLLREMSAHLAGEAARRMEMVLQRVGREFAGRQWASGATASSEYSAPNWAAAQATGEPNTREAGDHSTAWAPREQDADSEWLQLTFEIPVRPIQVRIHETYNPGSITRVEAMDSAGAWRTVWEGAAEPVPGARWFEVSIAGATWTTREIRLTLDSKAVPGWNEIDAVELVGSDPLRAARR